MAAPGWRRLVSGLALGSIVLAAVAAATATSLTRMPGWGTAAVAGVALVAGLALDPFKRLVGDWIEQPRRQRKMLEAHLRMRDRRGRPRRVRDCTDAVTLGVHPAAGERPGPPGLPPYVRRDVHESFREVFGDGGLVIIEGRSAAGKTRLAYEVMREYTPERWLIAPETPDALRELRKAGVPLRQAVIWLDDIERYLAGGGLDAGIQWTYAAPGSPIPSRGRC